MRWRCVLLIRVGGYVESLWVALMLARWSYVAALRCGGVSLSCVSGVVGCVAWMLCGVWLLVVVALHGRRCVLTLCGWDALPCCVVGRGIRVREGGGTSPSTAWTAMEVRWGMWVAPACRPSDGMPAAFVAHGFSFSFSFSASVCLAWDAVAFAITAPTLHSASVVCVGWGGPWVGPVPFGLGLWLSWLSGSFFPCVLPAFLFVCLFPWWLVVRTLVRGALAGGTSSTSPLGCWFWLAARFALRFSALPFLSR